jgi:hypothetical protein
LQCPTLSNIPSGFCGLVVSMLASGTQDRGFEPGRMMVDWDRGYGATTLTHLGP